MSEKLVTVELPEPKRFAEGELEWGISGVSCDGYVNLDEGVVTIDIGADDGFSDGYPTVLEGKVPASLVGPLAAALLAVSENL